MDDNLLIVKAEDQKKKRRLLLKRLYYHQFIEGSSAEWWNYSIVAKEVRPEAVVSEKELIPLIKYLHNEGLINIGGAALEKFSLTHDGIKEAERLIDIDKERPKTSTSNIERKKPLDDDIDDEITRLYKEGETDKDISRNIGHLKLLGPDAIKKRREKLGLVQHRKK